MLMFKQVTNQEKSFFIFIQFLLRIDQYYCRRSVLESSRYFYKCSFRRYLGYTKMVIDLWGLSKRSRFLKGSPFLGRLSCMLFARYIVTADLSISHKEVFFCFVLSKELECRLTRDLIVSGDLTTSKVIPVGRTVTQRLNLNSFWFSGFQVYSISKGMRVFHEGFQNFFFEEFGTPADEIRSTSYHHLHHLLYFSIWYYNMCEAKAFWFREPKCVKGV